MGSANSNCHGDRHADLGTAALRYVKRGWSVLPARGKTPTVSSWKPYQNKRASEETVRAWFDEPGVNAVAVFLGPISGGLACRDFDTRESYHRWAQQHPDLAR